MATKGKFDKQVSEAVFGPLGAVGKTELTRKLFDSITQLLNYGYSFSKIASAINAVIGASESRMPADTLRGLYYRVSAEKLKAELLKTNALSVPFHSFEVAKTQQDQTTDLIPKSRSQIGGILDQAHQITKRQNDLKVI